MNAIEITRFRCVLLAALLVLSATTKGAAQAGSAKIEILSKADAREVFAMSKTQWNENVRLAVGLGISGQVGRPETGLGMVTRTEAGLLLVVPDYSSNDERPDFIQLSIGYDRPPYVYLTDLELESAIQEATKQMRPDFEVVGGFERIEGGINVWFAIMESAL